MNNQIIIDAALGGIYDRIGFYLTQAGLEDASGARRFYMELLRKGQLDKVAIDLRVNVETLFDILFEHTITAAVEEEREACAQIAEIELAAQRELLQESKEENKELSYVGHSFGAQSASDIARKIRVRGDKKTATT